jgi:predicted NBD/HSP70 family sugar kinase
LGTRSPANFGPEERPNERSRPLREAVLRMIWEERRISRSDIARRAALSRSTVSEIVASLLPTGLVREGGPAPSRGGRRPIVLEFVDDAYGILGVEIGAAHVGVAVTDLRGRVLAWNEVPFDVRNDPVGTRRTVIELCEKNVAQWGRRLDELLGIGIGLPAPVDPQHPDLLSELVLPAWKGRSGMDEIAAHFDLPLLVDNDANLGAIAEHWWGVGRGVDDFAYIKVATGIGSGHLIDGEVYRGATGVAGEIGHMAIDPNGPRCVCGLRGCLTTFVGRPALVLRARVLAEQYPDSALARAGDSLDAIEEAALNGDRAACQLVDEAARNLGIAVSSMLNLMNPSRIVVGGHFASLGDLLLDPLRDQIAQRALVSSVAATDVMTSDLGPRTTAVGAATMVLEAALSDSRMFPMAASRQEAP